MFEAILKEDKFTSKNHVCRQKKVIKIEKNLIEKI